MEVGQGTGAPESGPLATVRLPNGQSVRAVALQRIKDRDGSWRYLLTVSLWARVESRNRLHDWLTGEPAPIRFLAPAAIVTPINGQGTAPLPLGGRAPMTLAAAS